MSVPLQLGSSRMKLFSRVAIPGVGLFILLGKEAQVDKCRDITLGLTIFH
jgi:hypothetical protein